MYKLQIKTEKGYPVVVEVEQKVLYTKRNKTARIRAKPWVFRLHFNVYGAAVKQKNWLFFRVIYRALIVPNWPKWQSLNPHNFTKNDHGWNIFSNLSSGQQYLLNDKKRFRQKWLVKKSKLVWRKRNPPRAQIFRYFRIESRNKNDFISLSSGQQYFYDFYDNMTIFKPP